MNRPREAWELEKRLLVTADLLNGIKLMLAVQSWVQKYFPSHLSQITLIFRAVPAL